jgi:hypothetical protein
MPQNIIFVLMYHRHKLLDLIHIVVLPLHVLSGINSKETASTFKM